MEKEKKTKPSIAVNFDVYEVIIYRISVFFVHWCSYQWQSLKKEKNPQ